MRRRLVRASALVGLLLLTAGGVPSRAEDAPMRAALLLVDDEPETRRAAAAAARASGVRVPHAFDGFLVVEGPSALVAEAAQSPWVRERVAVGEKLGRAKGRSEVFRILARAWSRDGERRRVATRDDAEGGPGLEEPHAWLPPVVPEAALSETLRASTFPGRIRAHDFARVAPGAETTAAEAPYGATPSNTSEYLAGSVSINLFLVQSDGSVDASTESWTEDREAQVIAEIVEAMDWIRSIEPQAAASFVYHVFPGRTDARARTAYEPVRRPADPLGSTGETLWATEILGGMGYPVGDRFARSRALAHETRLADGTDWAVNVFVVDSLKDADGTFADGRFAYAWIGGPHLVMTYDNQNWGISRMNQVARHEILHTFYAFDEYSGSGCSCTESRGYLDGRNVNCVPCNGAYASCVMISNGSSMCAHTRRQVGWADLDSDGVVDVVGEDPDTFTDALPARVCGGVLLSGLAAVVAPTNRNPATVTPRVSISINAVSAVDVRVDGGSWVPAEPEDGSWGSPTVRYRLALDLLPGTRTIESRAVDDRGNRDLSPAAVAVEVSSGAVPVGSSLALQRSAGGILASWTASAGAVSYRLYRAPSASGPWVEALRTTATTAADGSAGSTYYVVRAVDACGDEAGP